MQLIQAIQPKVAAQTDKPDAAALREFTSSLKIEQHKDRAVLTATLPVQLLRKLATPVGNAVSGSPVEDANPTSAPGR
jgi:hypothetical protein